MAELELHGYLTTGKFYVNDYTITIERVDGGVLMTITDGNTGKVQTVSIKDGTPGMTDDDIKKVEALIQTMTNLNTTCGTNETDRVAAETKRAEAEAARDLAENGAEGEKDKTKYRTGLYELALALYNELDKEKETILKYADDAAQYATNAANSADAAAKTTHESLGGVVFFGDGETLTFKDEDSTETMIVSSASQSPDLDATGYVTDSGKMIRIKIPLAKRLDNINSVTFTKFMANIANSGGYGLTSSVVTKGNDFLSCVSQVVIDKVQNCIHVIMKRPSDKAFILNNNESVQCRCKEISFTLSTASASDTAS